MYNIVIPIVNILEAGPHLNIGPQFINSPRHAKTFEGYGDHISSLKMNFLEKLRVVLVELLGTLGTRDLDI